MAARIATPPSCDQDLQVAVPDDASVGHACALVGRDAHRAVAGELLDRLRGGQGGLLLLSGEPGVGKSRLADELTRSASDLVTVQVCADRDRFCGRRSNQPRDVGRAVAAPGTGALVRGAGNVAGWWRQVASTALTSNARILLVLDDLQAASPSALTAIDTTLPHLAQASLLVVLIARLSPAQERLSPLWARWETIPTATRMVLQPLPPDPALRLVRTHLPGGTTGEQQAVMRAGAGNPGLLLELCRWSGGGGAPQSSGLTRAAPGSNFTPSPPSLVNQRVRAHDRGKVLTALAILDAPTSPSTVARILDLSPAEVRAVLRTAIRQGLVTEPASGRFGLAHPLFRTVLLGALKPAQRSALHRRAAGVLIPLAEEASADLPGQAVAHIAASGVVEPELARHCLFEAERLGAHRPKEALFAAVTGLRQRPRAGLECRLTLAEARALAALGRADAATDRIHGAIKIAERLGDGQLFVTAVLDLFAVLEEADRDDPSAEAHLAAALTSCPPTALVLRARLQALACRRTGGQDVEAALSAALPALRLAWTSRDSTAIAEVVGTLSSLTAPAALPYLAEVSARVSQLTGPTGLAALPGIVSTGLAFGRRDTLDLTLEEFSLRERNHPNPQTRRQLRLLRLALALLDGDEEVVARAVTPRLRAPTSTCGPDPVLPAAVLWHLSTGGSLAPAAQAAAVWLPVWLRLAAAAEFSASDTVDGAATDRLGAIAGLFPRPEVRLDATVRVVSLALGARAAALTQDRDRCAEVVERFRDFGDQFLIAAPGLPVAPIGWLLAEPLALLGSPEEADAANRQAEVLSRALRSPAWTARCLLQRARLQHGRDPVAVAVALTEARHQSLDAGLTLLVEQSRQRLRALLSNRASVRRQAETVTPGQAAAPSPSGSQAAWLERLAAREPGIADVLELVQSGGTNAEIARALGCSVPTIERRLGRVYRQLGLRNRTQLVAALTGQPHRGSRKTDRRSRQATGA